MCLCLCFVVVVVFVWALWGWFKGKVEGTQPLSVVPYVDTHRLYEPHGFRGHYTILASDLDAMLSMVLVKVTAV